MCKILQIVVCFLSAWSSDVARLKSSESPGLIPVTQVTECRRFPVPQPTCRAGAVHTTSTPSWALPAEHQGCVWLLQLDWMIPVGPTQLRMLGVFRAPVLPVLLLAAQWRLAWAELAFLGSEEGWLSVQGPEDVSFHNWVVIPFSTLQPFRAFTCHAPISVEVCSCFCNSFFVYDILHSQRLIPVR